MSLMERARQAADQARHRTLEGASRAQEVLADPSTSARAKEMLGRARRGVATAIDHIDPSVLADVIIKATALQERANAALRDKGSPYRISEIGIGASIPPSVTFSIGRESDPEDLAGKPVDSVDLVDNVSAASPTIQLLDGTTVDVAAPAESEREP
jgi:hypothetical protein